MRKYRQINASMRFLKTHGSMRVQHHATVGSPYESVLKRIHMAARVKQPLHDSFAVCVFEALYQELQCVRELQKRGGLLARVREELPLFVQLGVVVSIESLGQFGSLREGVHVKGGAVRHEGGV